MTRRGLKRAFQSLGRGFKQVLGGARRGVKHIPAALQTVDKYVNTANKVMDTAGEYAQLAAIDTGNQRWADIGDRLQERAANVRSRQENSQLAKRIRQDFG